MKAQLNNIRISPKKASLVAGMVRNMNASEALNLLKFAPKRGAEVLYKVVKSAVANAENNFDQKPENLTISRIEVGKGMTYKRFRPVSRGRAHPILKKTSNITVEVTLTTGEQAPKPVVKEEKVEKKETKAVKKETKATKPAKKTESDVVVKEVKAKKKTTKKEDK